MCDEHEQHNLQDLLNQALSSAGGEQKTVIRQIFNSTALRTELFQLALAQVTGQKVSTRRNYRNHIFWLMEKSGNIWQGLSYDREIYFEALSQTQEWFSKNLERYQPERASFTTWFNMKLKYVIKDVSQAIGKNRGELDDSEFGIFDTEEDKTQNPDAAAYFNQFIEQIHLWMNREKKALCQRCVPQHPEINCYVILEKRLPIKNPDTQLWEPELSFSDLAKIFQVDEPVLRRCYREKCLPMLKRYLTEEYGW